MNLDLHRAKCPCNPAVGGIAKGTSGAKIDALGGVMGEVTDAVGIQFRLLKIPAAGKRCGHHGRSAIRNIGKNVVLENEPVRIRPG